MYIPAILVYYNVYTPVLLLHFHRKWWKNSSAFYISEPSYKPLLSWVQANYPQP